MEKSMKEIDNKAIGQRIREERENLNLSRGDFSEIIGLSEYYVGQLERGERQMSLPVLYKVANCLHISLDYLFHGKSVDKLNIVQDASKIYKTTYEEINSLLNKCSFKELELIKKIIKTILPYLGIDI